MVSERVLKMATDEMLAHLRSDVVKEQMVREQKVVVERELRGMSVEVLEEGAARMIGEVNRRHRENVETLKRHEDAVWGAGAAVASERLRGAGGRPTPEWADSARPGRVAWPGGSTVAGYADERAGAAQVAAVVGSDAPAAGTGRLEAVDVVRDGPELWATKKQEQGVEYQQRLAAREKEQAEKRAILDREVYEAEQRVMTEALMKDREQRARGNAVLTDPPGVLIDLVSIESVNPIILEMKKDNGLRTQVRCHYYTLEKKGGFILLTLFRVKNGRMYAHDRYEAVDTVAEV